MTVSVNCPHCGLPLQITENLYGQLLQCPHCRQTLTVQIPSPPPAPPPQFPPTPQSRRPPPPAPPTKGDGVVAPIPPSLRGRRQQAATRRRETEAPPEESEAWSGRWHEVWSGLMLINVATALWYLSLGLGVFLLFRDPAAIDPLGAGALALTLGSLTGTAFGVIGLRRCVAIPMHTRAKALALNAVYSGATFALGVLLYLVLTLLADLVKRDELAEATRYVTWGTLAFWVLTLLLVTLFLVRTAGHLNARRLRWQVVAFVIVLLAYVPMHLLLLQLIQWNEKAGADFFAGMTRVRYFTLVTSSALGAWLIWQITALSMRIRLHYLRR